LPFTFNLYCYVAVALEAKAAAEERLAGDVGRLEQEVYQLMVGLCTFNSVNP
jgi:hypothetical protein